MKETWLQPKNIMDRERCRADHPDYDPRTLYVPESFLAQQTPVRLYEGAGEGRGGDEGP